MGSYEAEGLRQQPLQERGAEKAGCLGTTQQAQSNHTQLRTEHQPAQSHLPGDMITVSAIAIYVVVELIESFQGVQACDVTEIPHLLRLDLDLDVAERISQTLDAELRTISWEEIVRIIRLIARLEDFNADFEDFQFEFENSQ